MSDEQLASGTIYPPLSNIRKVSLNLAVKIVEHAYKTDLATVIPEPKDKVAMISELVYDPAYISFIPRTYSW